MKYRLLVIACSQRKKPGPEWMPAIDRYDGPLWQTLRSIEQPPNLVVMAISAKYGMFRSWLAIDIYDDRMTPALAAAAIAGDVHNRFKPETYRKHWKATINELRDAGESIRYRLEHRYADAFEDVCMVGGALYVDVMRSYIGYYQKARGELCVSTEAKVTEINGSIGQMRQDMRAWICGKLHVSCT